VAGVGRQAGKPPRTELFDKALNHQRADPPVKLRQTTRTVDGTDALGDGGGFALADALHLLHRLDRQRHKDRSQTALTPPESLHPVLFAYEGHRPRAGLQSGPFCGEARTGTIAP
jgi:hypothetical protein